MKHILKLVPHVRVMKNQMSQYHNDIKLIPNIQSGFRPGHSCATAGLVLLDYRKAFDTINHMILIAKLKYVGFSASAVNLLQNYMQDRHQLVKIGNK